MENYRDIVLDHITYNTDRGSYVEIVPTIWFARKDDADSSKGRYESVGRPSQTSTGTETTSSGETYRTRRQLDPWWNLHKPVYAFNDPRIRSRLDKLMGSNVVRITDGQYMTKLQQQIKKEHVDEQRKRIQQREAEELEREKNLMLEGLMPVGTPPKKLRDHPVCRITRQTSKIIEQQKSKSRKYNKIQNYKTPSSKVTQSMLKVTNKVDTTLEETLVDDLEGELAEAVAQVCVADAKPEEDLAKGFMLEDSEYEQLKYEDPMVKALQDVKNVEELYQLAEKIVGPTKNTKLG